MFASVQIRWTSTVGQYRARQGNRSPLALHILLLYESMNRLDKEGTTQRDKLLDHVSGFPLFLWLPVFHRDRQSAHRGAQEWGHRFEATDHKTAIEELHRLSQLIHMLSEDFGDIQRRITFLLEASEAFQRMHSNTASNAMRHDHELLKALQRRCETSRSWLLNYRDRTNIRINLAGLTLLVHIVSAAVKSLHVLVLIRYRTLFRSSTPRQRSSQRTRSKTAHQ